MPSPHSKDSLLQFEDRIYVAGHKGLAGSAIWRKFEAEGYTNLLGRTSSELNLTNREHVFQFFQKERPTVVVLAAAKVGGILANDTYPADFLSENLQIQLNVMDAANYYKVNRLLFLGSSCIYPKFAKQPIAETELLTGELEPTNSAYAVAKIAGIMQTQASRKQFGRQWISAMPTNLYGRGDNFHPKYSHVLPALLSRFHEAKIDGKKEVVIWGSGKPLREFLHVDDLASAVLFLLKNYDESQHINVGVGTEISIHDLAELIASVVGYTGVISYDPTKPDGTPRKLLDNSHLTQMGWSPKIELRDGITETYSWFLANQNMLRSK